MSTLTIILLVAICITLPASIFLTIMLIRLNRFQNQFESFYVDLYAIIVDYHKFMENLFKLSVHYYDDTIHEFLEKTKILRSDVEEFLNNYAELRDYVIPEEPVEEPKEIIGLVRPDIVPRGAKVNTIETEIP